jgi:hypothetical protein
MISARAKAALAAAKRRGVKLGGERGRLTAKARAGGNAAQRVRAQRGPMRPTDDPARVMRLYPGPLVRAIDLTSCEREFVLVLVLD